MTRRSPPLDGTVLLTGASSGIGEAMAVELGRVATRLVLVARRADRLHALADRLRAARPTLDVVVLPADLADPADVERLIAALPGPVDVLINNAGLGDLTLFDRSESAKNTQMIAVNVAALVRLTHALVPGMVARGRGGVLNVSSGYGLTWTAGAAVYIGTKHFVTAFTEGLRADLAGTGVVVTQVCPGPVATEFVDVAGSWTAEKPPAFVFQTAEATAHDALVGFAQGRALVLPGFASRWVTRLGAWTPRAVMRVVQGLLGRWIRARG